jgi:hypothetical protein
MIARLEEAKFSCGFYRQLVLSYSIIICRSLLFVEFDMISSFAQDDILELLELDVSGGKVSAGRTRLEAQRHHYLDNVLCLVYRLLPRIRGLMARGGNEEP